MMGTSQSSVARHSYGSIAVPGTCGSLSARVLTYLPDAPASALQRAARATGACVPGSRTLRGALRVAADEPRHLRAQLVDASAVNDRDGKRAMRHCRRSHFRREWQICLRAHIEPRPASVSCAATWVAPLTSQRQDQCARTLQVPVAK